jgi:hypothetical protein
VTAKANLDQFLNADSRLIAFTSVGSYPILYVLASGDVACASCANDECAEGHCDPTRRLVAADVYWEGPTHNCEICDAEIESAYGDPAHNT